jgi:hypothetical protein
MLLVDDMDVDKKFVYMLMVDIKFVYILTVDKKFVYMLTVDDMDVDEKFASIFLLLLRPLQLSKLSMILNCGQHTFQIKAAAFNCCPHFKKDLFLSEPKNIQRSVRALNQKEVSRKGFGHRNGAMSEMPNDGMPNDDGMPNNDPMPNVRNAEPLVRLG